MGKLEFLNKYKWFQKLKKIKHIKVILVILLACLVLFVWLIDWGGKEDKSAENSLISSVSSTSVYAKELEGRLETALGKISGAGDVKVMITFDGVTELVLATTKDEKTSSTSNTTSSGANNTTQTTTVSVEPILITVNGSTTPIVLMEILPEIKGVVVIAQGANNVRVKLDLLKAIQALLEVSSSQVEVFTAN